MALKRGDIHWVAFPQREPRGVEIEKTRPCIIVSHTGVNEYRKTVVIVPLTKGSKEAAPIIIEIPSAGDESKAVCDQIVAVDKRRIGERIGSLTLKEIAYFEECLRKVLGL
jgi:mRNA interferase MazF